MNRFNTYLIVLFCVCFTQHATAETVVSLFEFSQQSDADKWQIVNDGVMGGRSSSQATINADGQLKFTGTLSLANNGGFASVRSRPGKLGLQAGQSIVMRVKGDGRRYTFNLYTPDRRTAFSYQMEFDTKVDEWTEVRLPVDKFVAHSFGRPMRNVALDPTQVQAVGVLLGDKKAGPFNILIDWINVQ